MTLIELVVVTTLIGLIAVVLAGAFSVIVRANPSNETRADDSRSMLGLVTYLPEDINSTPSAGFSFVKAAPSGCPGALDPGVNLVRMEWIELGTRYVANYRYEPVTGGYVVTRYGCTLPSGSTSRRVLTSTMPTIDESAWNAGDAPAAVTHILDGAAVVGLAMELTSKSNEVFVVEGRTNNPSELLPPPGSGGGPGGSGSTNTTPIALNVTATVPLIVSSDIGLNASDPDTDPLTATLAPGPYTSTAGHEWNVTVTDLVVTVVPHVDAQLGDAIVFEYTVDDARLNGTATAEVNLTAGDVLNSAPIAPNIAAPPIDERTNSPVSVPISDPDGNAMTVSLGVVDPSLTITIDSVSGNEVLFTVLASGAATNPTFEYIVDDGVTTSSGTVQLTVVRCAPGTPSPASVTVDRRNGSAAHKRTIRTEVTFTLPYNGPCEGRITFEFQRDLRVGGTLQQLVTACASGQCTATFAQYDGDWFPPDGNVATTHTWVHTFKLDNATAITPSISMTINGE